MKLIYPAIFTPFDNNKDGYTVEFPDLPGCVTEGYSLIDAFEMAADAASGWVLLELEEGNLAPAASKPSDISVPIGSMVNMVILDMDAYAEKYGSKTVKKSITIPAWLNTFGEKNNVNFSRVLSDALLRQAQEVSI